MNGEQWKGLMDAQKINNICLGIALAAFGGCNVGVLGSHYKSTPVEIRQIVSDNKPAYEITTRSDGTQVYRITEGQRVEEVRK